MFARLLLVNLFFVAHSISPANSSERLGLHRRRSSSESSEFLGYAIPNKLPRKKIDPQERRDRLISHIAELVAIQKREAQYLEDLRAEMGGIVSPLMRVLNYCVSGARPEEMIEFFEEQQAIYTARIKSLRALLFHVELFLLRQKKIS